MTQIQRDEDAVARIVARLSKEWQKEAERAVDRLYTLLGEGKRLAAAESVLEKEFPALFKLPQLRPALVEAAAYGYGIVPQILTEAQKSGLAERLARPWTGDNMTLSERLHGTGREMRDAIITTVSVQMRQNSAWLTAADALYDRYGKKGAVIREQELPAYMTAVRRAARDAPDRDEILAGQRKALRQINRLAQNGAPPEL
jgi:hypothetical protein